MDFIAPILTLEFCPKKVEFGFYCDNNRLTSLEGVGYIGGDFFMIIIN
jgi:hypothetical protein